MGVDPNEWFDLKPHPHDSMPIATDSNITDEVEYNNKYADPEKLAELESTQGQPSTINKLNGMTMTDAEKSFFVDRWTEWNKKLEKLVVSKSFTQLPLGTQRLY